MAYPPLSAELIERSRLLDDNDPAAQEFVRIIEPIKKRLLEGIKAPNIDVHFVLSADESPNAWINTYLKPPVICFTRGLLEILKKESDIAAVLAHELSHQYFHDQLGSHINTVSEELGSDGRAVYMLRRADYPQEAMGHVMRTLTKRFPDDRNIVERIFSWGDPHPSDATRQIAIAAVEKALERGPSGEGIQDKASIRDNSIPTTLFSALKRITYKGYVGEWLDQRNYAGKDTRGKVEILVELLRDEVPKFRAIEPRFEDTAKAIGELKLDKRRDAESINQLVDVMALKFNSSPLDKIAKESFYPSLGKALGGSSGRGQPRGKLEQLNDAIQGFMAADSLEAARSYAKSMAEIAKPYPFDADNEFLRSISFSSFGFPRDTPLDSKLSTPIAPPWDKQMRWALQEGEADIARALFMLNVSGDPRVKKIEALHFENNKEPILIVKSSHQSIYSLTDYSNYFPIYNGEGQIIGFNDQKNLSHQLDANLQRLEEKHRQQKEALSPGTVDWAQLISEPANFFRTYNDFMMPTFGFIDEVHPPFADALLQHINQIDGATSRKAVQKALLTHLMQAIPNAASDAKNGDSNGENTKYPAHGWGMSPEHPYVEFVMKVGREVERLALIQHVRHYDLTCDDSPQKCWKLDNKKLFEETAFPIKTAEAFFTWMEHVKKLDVAMDKLPKDLGFYYARDFNKQAALDVVQFEALRCLEHLEHPCTTAELLQFRKIASLSGGIDAVRAALAAVVGEHITTAVSDLPDKNVDLHDLIEQYRGFAASNGGVNYIPPIFVDKPDLRERYQDIIQEKITAITNPYDRYRALTHLMSASGQQDKSDFDAILEHLANLTKTPLQGEQYTGGISDPSFQQWVTKEAARGLTEYLLTFEEPERSQNIMSEVDRIKAGTNASNSYAILDHLSKKEFGNQLLFQQYVAQHIKKSLDNISLQESVSRGFEAAAGIRILELLASNYHTQEATVDFFLVPFTREAGHEFLKQLKEAIKKESDADKKATLVQLLPFNLSEDAQLAQIELLHRNFWELPFAARTLAAEMILFHRAESRTNTVDDHETEKARDKIFERLLPENGTLENKYARLIVDSYLEAHDKAFPGADGAHKAQQYKRTLLSAMMVANVPSAERDESKNNLASGEGIRLVLDALGPAGRKLKQAIESHPQTPAFLKEQLKDSKTMAVDMRRDEIINLVQTLVVPEEVQRRAAGETIPGGIL